MTKHPLLYSQDSSSIVRTKIVCTLGPASCSEEIIRDMILNGMAVARINMAHCDHEFVEKTMKTVRNICNEIDTEAYVAIWLDLNGPKVRTGATLDNKPIQLHKGDEFLFVNDTTIMGDSTQVSTTYTKELLNPGDAIAVDDGIMTFTVLQRVPHGVKTRVENSGVLSPNKGINFPMKTIKDLPAVSEKDRQDVLFAIDQEVDYISISCIRDIEDIEEVRLLLGNSRVKLIAKIENKTGMDNFEPILKMCDAIVIDRGYLGAEVDVAVVAIAQKKMISLVLYNTKIQANSAGKPILVANQMLENMKSHPRPTRSEAADIANAVMDGVDGLVLSAETAVGDYVVESIQVMRRISYLSEQSTNYFDYQIRAMRNVPKPLNVSESIASSAVTTARQVNARYQYYIKSSVIVVITEVGGTARLVAKYRPQIPVVAATMFKQTAEQLNLHFGLVPYFHTGSNDSVIPDTLEFAVNLGLCKAGDTAVITSGQIIGFLEGTTTKMQIIQIPQRK